MLIIIILFRLKALEESGTKELFLKYTNMRDGISTCFYLNSAKVNKMGRCGVRRRGWSGEMEWGEVGMGVGEVVVVLEREMECVRGVE